MRDQRAGILPFPLAQEPVVVLWRHLCLHGWPCQGLWLRRHFLLVASVLQFLDALGLLLLYSRVGWAHRNVSQGYLVGLFRPDDGLADRASPYAAFFLGQIRRAPPILDRCSDLAVKLTDHSRLCF